MKEIIKVIFGDIWLLLLLVSVLATAVINVYLKFANIDMTEMRLFVTYWPVFILEPIVIIGLFVIYKLKK